MSKIEPQKASNNDSDKEDENFSSTGSLQDSDGEEESQLSAGLILLNTNARFVVTSITKSTKYICKESRFPSEFFSKLLVLLALPRQYRSGKESFRKSQRLKHF